MDYKTKKINRVLLKDLKKNSSQPKDYLRQLNYLISIFIVMMATNLGVSLLILFFVVERGAL
jgi:hypothetical protein